MKHLTLFSNIVTTRWQQPNTPSSPFSHWICLSNFVDWQIFISLLFHLFRYLLLFMHIIYLVSSSAINLAFLTLIMILYTLSRSHISSSYSKLEIIFVWLLIIFIADSWSVTNRKMEYIRSAAFCDECYCS